MIGEGGGYGEARNLVHQAYVRESEAILSATTLAEGPARGTIAALAKTFTDSGETADMARLNQYASAKGVNTSVTLSADDQKAAGLVPIRMKPAPTGFGGGGGGGGGRGAGGSSRAMAQSDRK